MAFNSNLDEKRCFSVRETRGRKKHGFSNCMLQHKVAIGSDLTGIEMVDGFLPERSLSLRRNRTSVKRLGTNIPPKCNLDALQFNFKKLSLSPQSRTPISVTSSPTAVPLAHSIPTTDIVPSMSTAEIMKEDISTAPALPSPEAILPVQSCTDANVLCPSLFPADANVSQTAAWLRASRFQAYESTFANLSASDILRFSRDELIKTCGLADGIRLYNALHAKPPSPKLSLYFTTGSNKSFWRVVYLESLTFSCLTSKLLTTLHLPHDRLLSMFLLGPQGIHVLFTDELVANMKDDSLYVVELIKVTKNKYYSLLLKPCSPSDCCKY